MHKKTFWEKVKANMATTLIAGILGFFASWGGNYVGIKMALTEHSVEIKNCKASVADLKEDYRTLRSDFTSHLEKSGYAPIRGIKQ